MYCPFMKGRQYNSTGHCEQQYCALWLKDQNCCSITAIATGVLSPVIMPTVQSGRVSINDISPSYETTSNVEGIHSKYPDFDYEYAFGGGL